MMQSKVADYLASIVSLIVMATYELPGLVSLECDLNRMPNIDSFKANPLKCPSRSSTASRTVICPQVATAIDDVTRRRLRTVCNSSLYSESNVLRSRIS